MKKIQPRQYFAEIFPDRVLIFDDFGRDVASIARDEVAEEYPFYPEEAWESLLRRVERLYCIV